MKKKLITIFSLVMALTLLVACGGNKETTEQADAPETEVAENDTSEDKAEGEDTEAPADGEKTTITFWTNTNEPWVASYENIAKQFEEENPEYKVVIESWPFKVYGEKIQTALTNKEGSVDVIAYWGGSAPVYVESDGLAEMPEDLVQDMESDYLEPTYGIWKKDGKYYGIPMEFNLEYGGMIVNKKLMDEGGYEYPKTWDELRSLSKEVAVSNGDLVEVGGFQMLDSDSFICNFMAMILQQGGQYLNEDGSINFATPEGVKALEEILSMYDDKEVGLDNLVNGEYSFNNVYRDEAYMASVGPWAIGEGPATYDLTYGEDFEYVPVPQYGQDHKFASESGWGLMVPANSKNVDAAWDFVRFFSQPDILVEHNIAADLLPPRKSLLDNEKYLEAKPHVAFLLDILPEAQWMGPYKTMSMREILDEAFINLAQQDPAERDIEGMLKDVSEQITNTCKISYSAD